MASLRVVLGDQLSHDLTSLADIDLDTDIVLMCEVNTEATYVKHHKKKIAFIFSAMRHFAAELEQKGVRVHYTQYKDPDNAGSFSGEVKRATQAYSIDKIIVTEASEYRVLKETQGWQEAFDVPVEIRADKRFLCSHRYFNHWAEGRKQLRMEYFYRQMRKDYNILMDGDQPEGGEWNYDAKNRQSPKAGMQIPTPYSAPKDEITEAVCQLVSEEFADHFGDLEPFYFAVTREQALEVLNKFIDERLPQFGDYQDAMIEGEPWMYHSHIAFYINTGLLNPREAIEAAELAYVHGNAPLNAVEGFIRQILGWREYVRGIYWLKMPDYTHDNFLEAKNPLPPLYWGEKTYMNCLSQCVKETQQNAYAHHIQRLMVLGNFALLTGLSPEEVNEWYLLVYADAFEWVEMPNVSGMVLFADGGLLGSKPYAAGGAYINKMSNYCKSCRYKVTKKTGPDACPFNYLYWDFFMRNEDKLAGNPRLNMVYGGMKRMNDEKRDLILRDASQFMSKLNAGEVV
ncbi:cryptochrome/photolyase family protein [Leucothrix sargassi]|nr:cryptochrome/photolyase family protein [Leucothrix sargassi]